MFTLAVCVCVCGGEGGFEWFFFRKFWNLTEVVNPKFKPQNSIFLFIDIDFSH